MLKEAAAETSNATLKRFLTTRAAAFLSNDYYASDVAWMDLDAPLDITIGPYETYNDEIFGYKAAYEAYINIRDEQETEKVKFFSAPMQEIENNLPIDAKYRNPKIGALAPIRVVNEIILIRRWRARRPHRRLQPAQRRARGRAKGQQARDAEERAGSEIQSTLEPIAKRVLRAAAQADLSFDSFFTHILAHELTHGIGPHQIRSMAGRQRLARS